MKALIGLVPATAGRISIDGIDVTRMKAHERSRLGIGYVPQGRGILPGLTALENLRLAWTADSGDTEAGGDRAHRRHAAAPDGAPRPQGRRALGRRAADPGARPRADRRCRGCSCSTSRRRASSRRSSSRNRCRRSCRRGPLGVRSTQSNLPGQQVKRPVDLAFVQAVTVQVDQEIPLCSRAEALIPALHVVGQDFTSRGMQRTRRDFPNFAPRIVRMPSDQSISPSRRHERLAQPQACDRQQAEKAVVGPGPQRVDRRSRFSSPQQFPDFVIGIEVWLSACGTIGQQPQRWNFGQRIRGTPVTREATHNAESRRPFSRLLVGVLGRPLRDAKATVM